MPLPCLLHWIPSCVLIVIRNSRAWRRHRDSLCTSYQFVCIQGCREYTQQVTWADESQVGSKRQEPKVHCEPVPQVSVKQPKPGRIKLGMSHLYHPLRGSPSWVTWLTRLSLWRMLHYCGKNGKKIPDCSPDGAFPKWDRNRPRLSCAVSSQFWTTFYSYCQDLQVIQEKGDSLCKP